MTEERERQISERKREKRKNKQNKYLPRVIIVLLLIATLAVLSFTVFFKIDKVETMGESKYSSKEIIKASGVTIGESILLLDTKTVQRNIEESFKDIGEISVEKKIISGKVVIADRGYTNLVAIKNKDKYVVLDSNKQIRRILEKKPKGVIELTGLKLKDAVLYSTAEFENSDDYIIFTDLKDSLKANGFEKITAVNVEESDNISISYDGRIKMLIGTLSNLDEKLKKAKYIVTEQEDEAAKGTLDLTVDNTAYFKERE